MYGIGAFNVTNNIPPGGAPFPAGSAENGLSVDPVSGKIVLGNDFLGTDAQLLSLREIPLNNFPLVMRGGAAGSGGITVFQADDAGTFAESHLQSWDGRSIVILYDQNNGNQASLESNDGGATSCNLASDGTNGWVSITASNLNILVNFTGVLNNHAGALAGTLNNSPVAGNPTKWIAIRDNGVIRRIPTW